MHINLQSCKTNDIFKSLLPSNVVSFRFSVAVDFLSLPSDGESPLSVTPESDLVFAS